jgi:hypothetical protein
MPTPNAAFHPIKNSVPRQILSGGENSVIPCRERLDLPFDAAPNPKLCHAADFVGNDVTATSLTLTQSRISHEGAEKEHGGEQSERPIHSLANQSRDG